MPSISNCLSKEQYPSYSESVQRLSFITFQEKTSNKSLSERSEQLLGLFKTLCCRYKKKEQQFHINNFAKKKPCKTTDKSLFIKPHCCGRSVALRVRLVTFLGHSEAATQQGRGAGLFVEGGSPKRCRRGVLESRGGGQLLKLGAGVLNNIEYPNEILPIICIHRFRNTKHEEERQDIFSTCSHQILYMHWFCTIYLWHALNRHY